MIKNGVRNYTKKDKTRYGSIAKDCPTLKGIINKISGENRILAVNVEEIIEHYNNWARDCMSSGTVPSIRIPHFGTFFVSANKSRNKVRLAIEYYRRGVYTYERAVAIINRYYPIYKRANKEELIRGRGITRKGGVKRKSLRKLIGRKMKKDWANS